MGKHTNTRVFNIIAWATAIIVIGLSLIMMWQSLRQMLGHG